MNQTPDRFPASRSEFQRLVEGSPYAEILRDESKLRTIVIDAMQDSADPLTREIGAGLGDGTMAWSTIATTAEYADFLHNGLSAVRQFDLTQLAEGLEATEDGHDDDDGEDLWQGLYEAPQ